MSVAPYDQPGADAHADAVVAEWLRKAIGDLRTADRELRVVDRPNLDAVCFHAQQSAEKVLKAFLESRGQRPPKVHDLVHLRALVSALAPGWTFPLNELSELSHSAVEARYPGFSATLQDARQLLDIAQRLWVALRPLI